MSELRAIAAALFVCTCGPPAPAPVAKKPSPPPEVEAPIAAPTGERVKGAPHELGKLAAIGSAPKSIEARYELAANLAATEPDRAFALLHELLTRAGCKPCDAIVVRVGEDTRWAMLAGDPTLQLVIADWTPRDDYPREDWDGTACPPGTARMGKLDDDTAGELWCEKPGGVRHGPYVETEFGVSMGEGSRVVRASYRDGKLHGHQSRSESYSDYSSSFFISDEEVGVSRSGHENSSEVEHQVTIGGRGASWTVDENNDMLIGRLTPTGSDTSVEETWQVTKDGWRVLASRVEKRGGRNHGALAEFHDNGEAYRLATYDTGVPHGVWAYWSADGTLLGKTRYDRGDGLTLQYDRAGKLVERGKIVGGKKVGPWIEEKGRGTYKAGVRVGRWTIKPFRIYSRAEGVYKAGLPDGVWRYHRADGEGVVEGTIRAGKPIGEWRVPSELGEDVVIKFNDAGEPVEVDDEAFDSKAFELDPESFVEHPEPPSPRGEGDELEP